MASGLVLFFYIGAHLINHALGLISIDVAEGGMWIATQVWYSTPGTVLLYGAAATHFVLALWAVYERRTFRLPIAELIRIALGFSLPIILIGHAANTRIAYDVYGLSSDYTRVVANLWASGSQGWQLGVMAPGWIHGCLGLNFAFRRRPLFQQLRLVLFAGALLLPIFSGLGFIAMGKELHLDAPASAAAQEYLTSVHAAERRGIEQWRDRLIIGYFVIVGAAFAARAVRNAFERGRKRLVTISYPGRSVRVPRGWTVLEASRSFHIPHASMCGGRARCSTCRARVTSGANACPDPGVDEQATLNRIGAAPDVRLACQLRPQGSISVIPLVRTEKPIYRPTAPRREAEREIVMMFCDFRNWRDLALDHLAEDLLYVLTLYTEAIGHAIRAAGGTVSYIEPDRICALFGLERGLKHAARQALQAASAIDDAIADLNERLGEQWNCKADILASIHASRAAVGEVGSAEPPAVLAVGDAMNFTFDLRRLATERGKKFAISEPVYKAAALDPTAEDKVIVQAQAKNGPIKVILSDRAPELPASWTPLGVRTRASLQRLRDAFPAG